MTYDTRPWSGYGDKVFDSLLARRVVIVRGELDDGQVSLVAASLMTLDALGDDHVELRLHSASGTIDAALALGDIIDALGVPVHTSALGTVAGGAVGVLASGAHRVIAPHASLHLREPDTSLSGRSGELERSLDQVAERRTSFFRALSHSCRRDRSSIEAEWSEGRFMDASQAVAWGYADSLGS